MSYCVLIRIFFCNLQRRARTHAVLVIGLYEVLGNPTTLLIEPPGPLYFVCSQNIRNNSPTFLSYSAWTPFNDSDILLFLVSVISSQNKSSTFISGICILHAVRIIIYKYVGHIIECNFSVLQCLTYHQSNYISFILNETKF